MPGMDSKQSAGHAGDRVRPESDSGREMLAGRGHARA